MSTYTAALFCHSWNRWLVLVLLGIVIVRTARGWAAARRWSRADERWHRAVIVVGDLQLTLGLWLYVVASPITAAFRDEPGRGMRDSTTRFFSIEHPTMMILALVALHAGRVRSRRRGEGPGRHARALAWTLLAVALASAGIPWPGLRAGRPLFRSPEAADVSG